MIYGSTGATHFEKEIPPLGSDEIDTMVFSQSKIPEEEFPVSVLDTRSTENWWTLRD